MKIAVSTDERTHLVETLLKQLAERGMNVVYHGPDNSESGDWPDVTEKAIDDVIKGKVDEAIVLCWTGTGCSIVANKVRGIRAALCHDGETAKGARIWNHANVLALSLRSTPDALLIEILDKWFDTPYSKDTWNLQQIAKIRKIEEL